MPEVPRRSTWTYFERGSGGVGGRGGEEEGRWRAVAWEDACDRERRHPA